MAHTIQSLMQAMLEQRASDLHLSGGSPPIYRVDGVLMPVGTEPLSPDAVRELVFSILSIQQRERFETHKELDFSYSIGGVSRYRGNLYLQRGTMAAAFRAIPYSPKTLDQLGFPPVLKELCQRARGLVLVTGPTGAGKSTTLAAMVEHVNTQRAVHVVTIEDPIEFLYKDKQALIHQRELGGDTDSFAEALKHVLRQDPDVILVGEMRDLETISMALTASETGHLVFATLHTMGAAATVDRIVDVFPPHQQQQIRMQLAGALEGVVSQTLVPLQDGLGRVCAVEIMVGTTAVRNLVRQGASHQLQSVIQSGGGVGMVTLSASLKALVDSGKVSFEAAMSHASNAEEFKKLFGKT